MSTLSVNTIQAQTGTTVTVPTGQTFSAPGMIVGASVSQITQTLQEERTIFC